MEDASKINQKLTLIQQFWPRLVNDMIQEAVNNVQNIDDYMQACLNTLKDFT